MPQSTLPGLMPDKVVAGNTRKEFVLQAVCLWLKVRLAGLPARDSDWLGNVT